MVECFEFRFFSREEIFFCSFFVLFFGFQLLTSYRTWKTRRRIWPLKRPWRSKFHANTTLGGEWCQSLSPAAILGAGSDVSVNFCCLSFIQSQFEWQEMSKKLLQDSLALEFLVHSRFKCGNSSSCPPSFYVFFF